MKCYWCNKKATRTDYREVDGITSKILSCDECIGISTESLLKARYGDKTMKQQIKVVKLKDQVQSLRKESRKYEKGFNILLEYFDSIYDDEKPKVDRRLKRIGL